MSNMIAAAAGADEGQPATRLERPRQRARTRARILRAARRVFLKRGYVEASVGEIVKRAGVSRAVVYLHFRDKRDLLEAVIRLQVDLTERLHSRASLPDPLRASDLERWMRRFIENITRSMDGVRLVNLGSFIDLSLGAITYRAQQNGLLQLAQRTPALRLFNETGELDDERFVELNMIIFEAGQVALAIGYDAWPSDPDIAIRNIVARLLRFVQPS